jgi:NitT/TauT family transport system permease protein
MSTKQISPFVLGTRDQVKAWFERNALTLLIVAVLLTVWEIYSRFFNTRGDHYFPSIDFVISQTIEFHEIVIEGFRITLTEIFTGFILSVILGILLGILFAESFIIRQSLLPTLVFAYSIPHAIVAPLFIIWFGTGLVGIGLFVAWFGFFTVFINTITGFSQVNEDFYHLGNVTGASNWQMIKHVKFWSALPHITSGIKVAVQQAVVGAIIAEFIATGGGLGYIIVLSYKLLRGGLMFGTLILIMIFAIIFYRLVEYLIDLYVPHTA